MKRKIARGLILCLFLFLPIAVNAEEVILPVEDSESFGKDLSSAKSSCIVSATYRSNIYTDIYQCAKTEYMEKSLPAFSDYPYLTFVFSWYFEKGRNIKDVKIKRKLISASLQTSYYENDVQEQFIIDDGSYLLWKVLDENTCFTLDNNMRVSNRPCIK